MQLAQAVDIVPFAKTEGVDFVLVYEIKCMIVEYHRNVGVVVSLGSPRGKLLYAALRRVDFRKVTITRIGDDSSSLGGNREQ